LKLNEIQGLVILPTSQVASFVIQQFQDSELAWCYISNNHRQKRTIYAEQILRHFRRQYKAEPSDNQSGKIVHELAREILAGKSGAVSGRTFAEVAEIAVEFNDTALFGAAVSSGSGQLPKDTFLELGKLLDNQPLESFKKLYGFIFLEFMSNPLILINVYRLSILISSLSSIHECSSAIQSIHCAISGRLNDLLEDRRQKIGSLLINILDAVRTCKPQSVEDGLTLVTLIQKDQTIQVDYEL